MIITQREGMTLEFTDGNLMLHNNDDNIDIMNYEQLNINIIKEDAEELILALQLFVGTKENDGV